LVEAVAQRWIRPPGPILDIGCGAGSNALWLSQNRFRVTGIDLAPVAIDVARRRASKARSRAEFTVGNILATSYPDTAFAGALDSGCFHSLPVSDRGRYAAEVARLLAPGGSLVITWIGREETGEFGPPHRPSLAEVTSILEPSFIFASTEYAESGSPRAWSAKGHRLCRYTGRLIRRRTPQPSAR
jgi:SAM-dependent methyltransferase